MQGPIMFREPGVRGRKPFIGPREQLVFFSHPQQKRGPKPMSAEMKAQREAERALTGTETLITPKKRGRMTEKERIAAANVGDKVKANGEDIGLSCLKVSQATLRLNSVN